MLVLTLPTRRIPSTRVSSESFCERSILVEWIMSTAAHSTYSSGEPSGNLSNNPNADFGYQ